ncbi:MAG TPA: oligoribonuclease [Actinomycetaceae bacterium]|nr:oligoribonuclease [Actinomycetaceae bacterium]
MTAKNGAIVWVDLEMTGLDVEKDAIVEVAVVVTDSELNALDDGIDLVVAPPAEALAQMSETVRTMHTTSGLLEELPGGLPLDEASKRVMTYIRRHVPQVRRAPLAGNSVGTDRAFLERYMPAITDHLHYRVIDVSSIKELARRWYPRAYFAAPEKNGGHRALADILESIDELRYYRAVLFPDGDGPDSVTARALAEEIKASPTGAAQAQDDGVRSSDGGGEPSR